MQEKILIKFSFLVTVLGLLFLFAYTQTIDLAFTPDLETAAPPEKVAMKGIIKDLKVTDKAVFFDLEGEKVVHTEVILFADENIYLREGDQVELTGQVEEYKGQKELIADKIVLK